MAELGKSSGLYGLEGAYLQGLKDKAGLPEMPGASGGIDPFATVRDMTDKLDKGLTKQDENLTPLGSLFVKPLPVITKNSGWEPVAGSAGDGGDVGILGAGTANPTNITSAITNTRSAALTPAAWCPAPTTARRC